MLHSTLHNKNDQTPIYKQIAQSIANQIENVTIKKNSVLPSINAFSETHDVARDTIQKAYKELKANGYIASVLGKGYYVLGRKKRQLKILLVFNKLSSFKKIIYYSFIEALGNKAVVDLHIHHHNPQQLKTIIDNNLGKYDHYVIMPYFKTNTKPGAYKGTLKKIPADELLLLDGSVPGFSHSKIVYQDFQADIFAAFASATDLLQKYHTLAIIVPKDDHYTLGIIAGLEDFCRQYQKTFTLVAGDDKMKPAKGTAYIVVTDNDLALLIKEVRKSGYVAGRDIGIISFNESPLKELLDITVMSTDFKKMGAVAAKLILQHKISQIKNPLVMIKRGSL